MTYWNKMFIPFVFFFPFPILKMEYIDLITLVRFLHTDSLLVIWFLQQYVNKTNKQKNEEEIFKSNKMIRFYVLKCVLFSLN